MKPNRLLAGVNAFPDSLNHAWKQLPYGKAIVWNNVSILVLEEEVGSEIVPFDIVLTNMKRKKVKIINSESNLVEYNLLKNGAYLQMIN